MPFSTRDRKADVDTIIEIFRTGRHTAMGGQTLAFGEADLAATVAAYDPALHEAPIVVGHPAADAPAYGWIGGLSVEGDRLQASARQVDAQFAEVVKAGRYKRVSASFYTPDSPSNPKPGVYYLRHVGFLGAQPPAVKGLKPVSFAAAEEGVVEFADGYALGALARLLRGLREVWIGRFGQEDADKALPSWDIDQLAAQAVLDQQRQVAELPSPAPAFSEPDKEKKDVTEKPSAREAELEAENARLREQTAAFAEAEAGRRRADDVAFLERLEKEGRLLPANRALAAGLLGNLAAGVGPEGRGAELVSFAEGRAAETPRDALRALLAAQPVAVDFTERAGGGQPPADADDPHALARAAVEFQEAEAKAGRSITTAQAVAHVRAQRQHGGNA